MAKSLLTVKAKKKPTPRQPKFTDERFTGGEPVWTDSANWTKEQLHREIHRGYFFYNYYMTPADMRKHVVTYGQKFLKWGKPEISAFAECEDFRVGITVCSFSKMILDGAPLQTSDFITNKIADLLAYGSEKIANKKVIATNISQKKSVQDHMAEKFDEIIGEIENYYDLVIRGDNTIPDFVAYFRKVNMPQQFVNRIRTRYDEHRAEITASQLKNADAQLIEGYKWIKRTDLKRINAWFTALLDALTAYGQVKSAVRKVRKAKPVSKEKLVKGVKFMAQFPELNLVSITPSNIIGSTVLWCYDTKTRKLIVYHAATDAKQLTIKGSTIIGYDDKLSVAKTLRKPSETLKEFASAGKIKLRTFMQDIKTTETLASGRINANQILLKAT